MIFFLFIASCFNEDSLINSVDDTEIILVVNDEGVTSKTFKKVFNKQKKIFRYQDTLDIKPEELIWIKNRVLDEIVKSTLLVQAIKKNNINIEEIILDRALQEAQEGYPEGAFAKTLELEDISMDDWKGSIKTNLLTKKLIQQQVNSA